MSGRGMKKWRPFSSLEAQAPSLQEMKYRKGRSPKPQISSERAAKIDDYLHDFKNVNFHITYYEDGYVLAIDEQIKKVDCLNGLIKTETLTIAFTNLLDLEIL